MELPGRWYPRKGNMFWARGRPSFPKHGESGIHAPPGGLSLTAIYREASYEGRIVHR